MIMQKSSLDRFKKILIVVLACILSAIFGFALRPSDVTVTASTSTLLRQSDEKVIEKKEFPNEPFQFANLKVKNTRVDLKKKFSFSSLAKQAGGEAADWIENLQFSIKNLTPKRMTYISVELDFPETINNGPMMVYNQLGIGIHPKALANSSKSESPLALESGDTFNFTLSPHHLNIIKDFLASRNFQLVDLNQVVIRIEYVIFDDGMKWSQGEYYRLNPNAESGYELIPPNLST